jgi:hemoglobin
LAHADQLLVMTEQNKIADVPALAEWAGGPEAIGALTKRFYEKVPQDPVLEPVFANMDPHHEVGLPSDPEFRAAFVGYLEWGTRLAVMNSQEGVAPPADDAPMPQWNWGPPGGPWRR